MQACAIEVFSAQNGNIDLSVQYCNNYCDPTSEYRNNNNDFLYILTK